MQHFVKKLNLKNFRNINEALLDLSPQKNLFVGPNGAGKTNYLEALYFACSLKTMSGFNNSDLITYGQESSALFAEFSHNICSNIMVEIFPQGKKAKLNQQRIKKSLELGKNFSLVYFVPCELNMITGSASLRRKALDEACNSIFFGHSYVVRRYEKILAQRNYLLKQEPTDLQTLNSFTQILLEEGSKIIFARLQTVKILAPFFINQMKTIFPQHEYALSYSADYDYSSLVENILQELIQRSQEVLKKERQRRVTLFGPHLHDLTFFINQMDAQKTCSRGQSRALVMAFKLSQIQSISQIRKIKPIVMLDDIVSELDELSRNNLLDIVHKLASQTFFSATSKNYFKEEDMRVFTVNNGLIKD